jgi:integrase
LPNLLTVDELKAVMAHAPDHCRWALDVEYNTGCRPGETELLKLKFSDVSWETNEITIRGTKTGERKVSLKPDFMTRLRNAYEKADSDYVITYKGKPIKRLQKSFNTALKKAGIKKRVRLYDLRHMYGTLMAKNKADIFALQKLMGHADIQTTKNYLHHAEDLKEDAVNNCLPGLDS